MPRHSPRNNCYKFVCFSADEDDHLVQFIATQVHANPGTPRLVIYALLGPDASESLSWSRHRHSKSWLARYTNNKIRFDSAAERYKAQKILQTARVACMSKPEPSLSNSVDLRVPLPPICGDLDDISNNISVLDELLKAVSVTFFVRFFHSSTRSDLDASLAILKSHIAAAEAALSEVDHV
ncbi:hypothetical protein C8R43DRAFT_503778 [Mycena crocata]|nr:hypothetical protein C8R43DRAFT_503778 [Mycena crocata]